MSDKNFAVANIVSTPSKTSWSQAYHAGKLFAVLSLWKEEDEDEEKVLSPIGKEFFTSLEQEFFTLEEKTLESIESAIEITLKQLPEWVKYSLAISVFKNDIAYIYAHQGKIAVKRKDDFGVLLKGGRTLSSASGRLEDKDLLILATKEFEEIFDDQKLGEALTGSPSEIAEGLAPAVHEQEGGAAAMIIEFHKPRTQFYAVETAELPKKEAIEQKEQEEEKEEYFPQATDYNKASFMDSIKKKLPVKTIGAVSASRKIILVAFILIGVIFAGSIYLAGKSQEDAKVKALFNDVYPRAEKKYEEGQNLLGLNQSLAMDSFSQAKKILDGASDKFPKDSEQAEKIAELSQKINKELGGQSETAKTSTSEASDSDSPLLTFGKKNNQEIVAGGSSGIYYAEGKSVYNSSKKEIIKDGPSDPLSISSYNGNLYVLSDSGVDKFTGSSFTKSSYFTGDKPDLSQAKSMAIDSSVFILLSNGKVLKYTKAKADTFNLRPIKALSSPTKIYTDADSEDLYILDKGNSRIVVFDKTGLQKTEYQADVIRNATNFDVQEKNKKIFILSSGKIYKIDLK